MGVLVISRQRDEIVDITLEDGRRIEVSICDVRGDKVRLGFQADKTITVNRREITKRIEKEGAR